MCFAHPLVSVANDMPAIFNLIIVLLDVGVILWLINMYLPLDPMIRKVINVVIVLFLSIWLLHFAELIPYGRTLAR
jgi:hypothetical protein